MKKKLKLMTIGSMRFEGEEGTLRRGVLFVADTDDDVRDFADHMGQDFTVETEGDDAENTSTS